ncbi:MAG TPA: methyltransferase domain-containing protein [Terriglobales bacterium]|nr:methyltransferase domain-containing protein [Terriglobales bacterium]
MSAHKSREWDSAAYDRISGPQFSWGKKVLARVCLRGDEHVLDAGCGTGKLSAELLETLPEGRVMGLDVSRNMLRRAHENLQPRFADRVTFVAADLQHLPFDQAFDGVFSTAAFHWVPDHGLLFRNLFRALRPGGWLIAQCGGSGNLHRFLARVAESSKRLPYLAHVGKYQPSWTFADPPTTATRLEAAGFIEIDTGLEPAPTRFANEARFSEFASKVILHRFLEHLPDEASRRQFMHDLSKAAAHDDPPFELDYWRLNLAARKPD